MTILRTTLLFLALGLVLSSPTPVWGDDTEKVQEERVDEMSKSLARLKGTLSSTESNRNPLSKKDVEAEEEAANSFSTMAMKMGKGLIVCVGLFFVGLSVMKRMRPNSFVSENRIKVKERAALSPKASLVIVEIDGREQLIAVGTDHVTVVPRTSPLKQLNEGSPQEVCGNELKLSA